jgi:hypothetical protein
VATFVFLRNKNGAKLQHLFKILVVAMLLVAGSNLGGSNAAASRKLSVSHVHTLGVDAELEQSIPINILTAKMQAPSFVGYGAYFDASSSRIYSYLGVSPNGSSNTSLWDWALCSSLNAIECAPGNEKWLSAWSILGTCQDAQESGCIDNVQASIGGSGFQDLTKIATLGAETVFGGDSSLGIPRASSPTKWEASDGTQYVLTSSTYRSFTSADNAWKSLGADFQLQIQRVSTTAVLQPSDPYIGPSPSNVGKHNIFGGGMDVSPLMFKPQTLFKVKVRLPNVLKGWFQARFKDGVVSSKALSATQTVYEISGEVAPVYIAGGAVPASALPSDFFTKLYPGASYQVGGVLGPINPGQGTRSMDEYKAWEQYFSDTALQTSYQWNVRSTNWPISNACFNSLTGVTGLLATNAAAYLGTPPSWNDKTGDLEYKVASPHLDENGVVASGSYTLSLPSTAAKCLYGSDTLPVRVEMEVGAEDGTTQIKSMLDLSENNGWLNFSIKGFHFSAPTIKLRLGRANTQIPSTTTVAPTTTLAPPTEAIVTTTTVLPPVWTPATVVAAKTSPVVRVSKSISAKSVASYAKISVAKTSKLSLRVTTSSAKYCKVSGTSLKGVKAGTCKVTVTVTLKSGKKSAKTVTLKIAK